MEDIYSIPLNISDIKNLSKWATFKAVVDIITGAITCLGIITAIFGVPQILAGVKLLAATDDLNRYVLTRDSKNISIALYNMNRFFKFTGAVVITKICLSLLILIFYGFLITTMFTRMPDIIRSIPEINF